MDFDAEIERLFEQLPHDLIAELGEERVEEICSKDPDRFAAAIGEAVRTVSSDGGRALAESLIADGPAMLARRRADHRAFEFRLGRRWARAFDLAEMALVAAYELGEAFNARHQDEAAADDDLVFAVLVRLHARGCRIAGEVQTLLRSGFGQGALGRWRALHEVNVVASFIATHGQDTAERYLLHEHVEALRSMQEMQARVDRLDIEPFTPEEMQAAEKAVDELVARFGPAYKGPYGWASEALAETDSRFARQRASFASIEASTGLDHLRPYYRLASHGVHANPKGILFTPDQMSMLPEVLLAGPASTGFADPGQCMLISLMNLTATLLTYKTGASGPMTLTALQRLCDEGAQAFVDVQRDVENGVGLPRYRPIRRLRFRLEPRLAEMRVRALSRLAALRGHRGRRARSNFGPN